jgi:hypothetical protein
LHADRVEGDHDPVIDIDRGDVAYHVGEMLGGDVGTDGVGVGILDGRRLARGHDLLWAIRPRRMLRRRRL